MSASLVGKGWHASVPRRVPLWLTVSAALLLLTSGCATRVATPLPTLSGRLALQVAGATARDEARGFSGNFELRGDAQRGSLDLSGPLGAGAVRAQWAEGRYSWDDGRGPQEAASLDALARDTLGEDLPLAALFDWLRARPWPGAPVAPRADGEPGFDQLGWSIDTSGAAEGRLAALRSRPPRISLRIRLDAPPAP